MSEISTEVLYEGQLATATLEQNGTVISEPNKKSTQVLVRDEQGNEQLATATYPLNKEAEQIPLLSITTAPSGTFAVGSKYYNSTDALIYTAVTANTWDGATTAAPAVIPTYYLFDGATYYWDGNSLEKTDTSAYEVKSNKTNSFTSTSEVTYPSSKGLSDGLATKAGLTLFPAGKVVYVDNGRTDSYTPDGSIIFPYKDIQSAHDAITDASATNTYEIRVTTGLPYTGTLNLTSDYITISGSGASKGAGFSGTVNISSQHLCVQDVHIKSGSIINISRVGHYLTEFKDCRASGVTFNIEATGSATEKADTWIQISGAASLWLDNTINATGIRGVLGMLAGSFERNTTTATDCVIQYGNCNAQTNITNLEAGTTMQIGGGLYLGNIINLKTGATLQGDITVFSAGNTLNNTGGTLTLLSPALAVSYNNGTSGLDAHDTQSAIDKLSANKANLVDGKVPSSELPSYVDDVVDLLTVSDTAPEEAAEGDMYYAPTAKLIYTYASGSWGSGATPEKGKIYIAVDTNLVYRWSGTNLVEISSGAGIPILAYFDVAAEATTVNTGVNLSAKTVKVYFNGLLQRPNVGETDYDYEITTTEGVSSVVFNTAFTAAAVICVEYI